jgi:hypothetical protein
MIRIVSQPHDSAPVWHAGFLAMLPAIERQARIAFKRLKPEARQDAVVEVAANAFVAYARLVELGKANLAYVTPLSHYAIAQVRDGRKVGNRHSVRDVLSQYAQRQKGFTVERLDRYDAEEDAWREIVVEDRCATPADVACTRIDFSDWLGTLSRRSRKIAESLALGERTTAVACRFRVSAARISQLRQEYYASWRRFHGEETQAEDMALAPAALA